MLDAGLRTIEAGVSPEVCGAMTEERSWPANARTKSINPMSDKKSRRLDTQDRNARRAPTVK